MGSASRHFSAGPRFTTCRRELTPLGETRAQGPWPKGSLWCASGRHEVMLSMPGLRQQKRGYRSTQWRELLEMRCAQRQPRGAPIRRELFHQSTPQADSELLRVAARGTRWRIPSRLLPPRGRRELQPLSAGRPAKCRRHMRGASVLQRLMSDVRRCAWPTLVASHMRSSPPSGRGSCRQARRRRAHTGGASPRATAPVPATMGLLIWRGGATSPRICDGAPLCRLTTLTRPRPTLKQIWLRWGVIV